MRQAHLLPFLWLRGEGAEAIRQGVAAIAEAGCGAFCAESRTHPDYLGMTWWRDIDVLTSACKEHGLTYYLLDECAFSLRALPMGSSGHTLATHADDGTGTWMWWGPKRVDMCWRSRTEARRRWLP